MRTGLSLATLAASILGATVPLAQQLPPGITRIPTRGAPLHHTLDLDTGELRPAARQAGAALPNGAGASAVGSTTCYANSVDDDDAFLDALLFPAGDELFDWGIKSCGGSTFVDRITIGFASQAVPTEQGGPGGSLTLRMYENAFGFGFPGNELLSLALTGLPSDGPGVPILVPYFLTIELGAQSFFLPDGPIGWSYENPDGFTAPLLVNVTIPLGTQNYFDVFRPGPASAGNYLGTSMLPPGGLSNDPFENSFWIEIDQNDATASAVAVPSPLNPDALTTGAGPIVGSPWVAEVAVTPQPLLTFVALALDDFSGPPTIYGEFLIDFTAQIGRLSISATGTHSYGIPLDSDVVGVPFFAQGAFTTATPAGLQLTNALALTIGTF